MAKYKLLKPYKEFKAGEPMEIKDFQLPYFKGMGFISDDKVAVKEKATPKSDVPNTKMDMPKNIKINPSK